MRLLVHSLGVRFEHNLLARAERPYFDHIVSTGHPCARTTPLVNRVEMSHNEDKTPRAGATARLIGQHVRAGFAVDDGAVQLGGLTHRLKLPPCPGRGIRKVEPGRKAGGVCKQVDEIRVLDHSSPGQPGLWS